jgi:hypothetical protein
LQNAISYHQQIQLVSHESIESVFRCADHRLASHVELALTRTGQPVLSLNQQDAIAVLAPSPRGAGKIPNPSIDTATASCNGETKSADARGAKCCESGGNAPVNPLGGGPFWRSFDPGVGLNRVHIAAVTD